MAIKDGSQETVVGKTGARRSVGVAFERAQVVLERACSPIGLLASPDGYLHVWAMGFPHQAWSAGMYIFAHRCVEEGRMPIFESGEQW